MKKLTLYPTLILALTFVTVVGNAQQGLVANQNPGYEESRLKYMSLADSMTSWHSTTSQETYTAIDYMADLRAERARRREYRRQVHLERIRAFGFYADDYGYYPSNGYYQSNGYYPGNGYYNNYRYNSSYYRRQYRNNPFWLPVTLGLNFHWH